MFSLDQEESLRTRSPIFGTNGCVASSQPLASQVGLTILKQGGTSADACVAMASMLAVTEPCSTGLGGDAFCLYYDAQQKRVYAINGSGRSPQNLPVNEINALYSGNKCKRIPHYDGNSVTVPGAVHCWFTTFERFGSKKLKFSELLKDAISYARDGYPVSKIAAYGWKQEQEKLKRVSEFGKDLLVNGQAPKAGEFITLPLMAKSLERVANAEHSDGFYRGFIAEKIVEAVSRHGGRMTIKDLSIHNSEFVEPISIEFDQYRLFQCPPNGQGIVTLIALGIYKCFIKDMDGDLSFSDYIHILIECLKLSFNVCLNELSDSNHMKRPAEALLNEEYLYKLSHKINLSKAIEFINIENSMNSCDTVYFCALDKYGNACSFINSTYTGFGSGIVPEECGFSLHNRGSNFILNNPKHPNSLAPNKRPYHTLMPGMLTDQNDNFFAAFGVMGAFMQPQGQLQVLLNILVRRMDPQKALEAPRFCIDVSNGVGHVVDIEDEFDKDILDNLARRGHSTNVVSGWKKFLFGRGQVIMKISENVFCAGSDPRADGCAIAF